MGPSRCLFPTLLGLFSARRRRWRSTPAADAGRPHLVHYLAGAISAPKAKQLPCGKVAICCAALTTPKGEMYWPPAEPKSHSTAKVYTSLFVRHWDAWSTENQNSLWYGQLARIDGKWTLETPGFTNLLAGTNLSSPVPPFGGTGDFDMSSCAICFVAKDPNLNPARFTKTDLYYTPIKSFVEKPATAPQLVKTGNLHGYSIAPAFSRDGKQIAFARMRSHQNESDKTRLMLVPDVGDLSNVQEFYETSDGKGGWGLRPDWVVWSHDGKELYVVAEEHARVKLWKLPSSPLSATRLPVAIYQDGCVAEAKLLGGGPSLLISTKSRVESSRYSVIDPSTCKTTEISSSTKNGRSVGLSLSQCDEIWYPGAAGYDNHALVTKPSNFDPSKKYPLAFLIHGGPQSAWVDDWSTRWNPAIFAEQGYVAVCPNPTGSTGYGQKHIDAIASNWGGTPYDDLVKCFEFLEEKLDYVDTSRAVALGASYGGYMISRLACAPV